MEIYNGIAASPGVAIGEAYIFNQNELIPKFSISEYQLEFEIDRFYTALRKTKQEYQLLQQKLFEEMSEDEAKFLDAHILMTEDQTLIQEVVDNLREKKKNLEWIIYEVTDNLYKKFTQLHEDYFKERAVDILDLGRKIIQKLLSQKSNSLADLSEDYIIITSDLSVSDTASMNKKHVLGFVTELGGKTSHTAILARSLTIPAVLGIKDISHMVNSGDTVIIDGTAGLVVINPDEATREKYKKQQRKNEKKEHENLQLKDLQTITLDEKEILLKANMEIPEQEIDSVLHYGAEGVGLYRSEFLYLSKKRKVLPTEAQQFNAYKFVLEKFKDKNVTIRTLDLGGDKVLEGVTSREANPNLGWRAIRFCLSNPDIFKTQIRALYRASIYGNLNIMLPMISNIDEIIETKKLIEEVKEELRAENIEFSDNIPLGVMIETPSAVLLSDKLAKMTDFFSIGTNDLIQYILACDRGNEKIAYLYQPLHPAVLQMIKQTVDNAHKHNIKVSICGEMGGEILSALILIGFGIDEISMTPAKILELKRVIRNIHYSKVKKLADEVLTYSSQTEVVERVESWVKENIGFSI